MAQLPALSTVLACLLVYLTYRCEGSKLSCEHKDVDPADCLYGAVEDYCGRIACAKGPDMRCGGPFDIKGKCGLGMRCSTCERCSGCSLHTLKCSTSNLLCLKDPQDYQQ